MHKVKTEIVPAVFLPKFQKPTSQLSRSKYRISVRGPALWNEFLTTNEKEIEK